MSALEQPNRTFSQTHLKLPRQESAKLSNRKVSQDEMINNVIDHHIQNLRNLRRNPSQKSQSKSRRMQRVFQKTRSSLYTSQELIKSDQIDEAENEQFQLDNSTKKKKDLMFMRNSFSKPLSSKQSVDLEKSLNLLSAYGQYNNFMKVNKDMLKNQGLKKQITQIKKRSDKKQIISTPQVVKKKTMTEMLNHRKDEPLYNKFDSTMVRSAQNLETDDKQYSTQDIESTEFDVKYQYNKTVAMTNQASQVELILPPELKEYDSKGVFVKPSDFQDSIRQTDSFKRRQETEENQSQVNQTGVSMDKNRSIKSHSRSYKTDQRASEVQEGENLIQTTFITNNTYNIVPKGQKLYQDEESLTLKQSLPVSMTEVITHQDHIINTDSTGEIYASLGSHINSDNQLAVQQVDISPLSNSKSGMQNNNLSDNQKSFSPSNLQKNDISRQTSQNFSHQMLQAQSMQEKKYKEVMEYHDSSPAMNSHQLQNASFKETPKQNKLLMNNSDLLALPDKDERLSQQPQSKNVLDNCDLSDINQFQQSQEENQQKQNQNDHKKQIQAQKTQYAPDLSGFSSSNDEIVGVAITVVNSATLKPNGLKKTATVVRKSDCLYKEKETRPFEFHDSQDSNRIMDLLIAENSAVDNNDMHRRSSQVSSKTTKTKNNEENLDKVINKSSELAMNKQQTQTTHVLAGIEDKVILVNSNSLNQNRQSQFSAIDDYVMDASQNLQNTQIMMSEAYSLGIDGSCPNTEQVTQQAEYQRQILMDSKLEMHSPPKNENEKLLNHCDSELLIKQQSTELEQIESKINLNQAFNNNASEKMDDDQDSPQKSPSFLIKNQSATSSVDQQQKDELQQMSQSKHESNFVIIENDPENIDKSIAAPHQLEIQDELNVDRAILEKKEEALLSVINESQDLAISPSQQSSKQHLDNRVSQSQIMITENSDAFSNKINGAQQEDQQKNYEYYDEEDNEADYDGYTNQNHQISSNMAITPSVSETPAIIDDKFDFYGQQVTQQQVLQMKVEEMNRITMQNQFNRRQQNQSALVIEEITARQEQSEKASKQDSILLANQSLTQKQLSWSQNSNDHRNNQDPLDKSNKNLKEQKPRRKKTGEIYQQPHPMPRTTHPRLVQSNDGLYGFINQQEVHVGFSQDFEVIGEPAQAKEQSDQNFDQPNQAMINTDLEEVQKQQFDEAIDQTDEPLATDQNKAQQYVSESMKVSQFEYEYYDEEDDDEAAETQPPQPTNLDQQQMEQNLEVQKSKIYQSTESDMDKNNQTDQDPFSQARNSSMMSQTRESQENNTSKDKGIHYIKQNQDSKSSTPKLLQIASQSENTDQNPFEIADKINVNSVKNMQQPQKQVQIITHSSEDNQSKQGVRSGEKTVEVIVQKSGKILMNKGTLVQSHELLSLQESTYSDHNFGLTSQEIQVVQSPLSGMKSPQEIQTSHSIKFGTEVVEIGEDVEYYDEEQDYYDEECDTQVAATPATAQPRFAN